MRISDWSSDVCSSDLFGALELCVFPTGRPLRRSGQQGVDQSSVLAGGMPHQAVDSLPYWLAFFAWVGQQRYVLWKEQVARLSGAMGAVLGVGRHACRLGRSEEHTSELQSLMRISYAVFCLKKKKKETQKQ